MGTLTVQTLQAPTSGANANKVIIPSGHTLDASNGLLTPAGHVTQVQVGGSAGYTSTQSTSGIDAISCSITPSATTSNVLVLLNLNGITVNSTSQHAILELYRDSTLIRRISDIAGYQVSHVHYNTDIACTYLDDSVSTTSSVTYKLTFATSNASTIVAFNNYGTANNRTSSNITLMEISG